MFKPFKYLLIISLFFSIIILIGVAVNISRLGVNNCSAQTKIIDNIKNPSDILTNYKKEPIPYAKLMMTCVESSYNALDKNPQIYKPNGNPPTILKSKYKYWWFNKDFPTVLVYEFDNDIIIAFRGTCLNADWLAIDANMKKKTLEKDMYVSNGYYNYYLKIQDQIHAIVKKAPKKTIHITGHSLGSSAGLICAYDLANSIKFPNTLSVCLFATPKTGNDTFNDSIIKSSKITYLNYLNYFDAIPQAPDNLGFKTMSPFNLFAIETNNIVYNHNTCIYQDGIDSAVEISKVENNTCKFDGSDSNITKNFNKLLSIIKK